MNEYRKCLDLMYAFGIVHASRPEAIGLGSSIDLGPQANLQSKLVHLEAGDDVEEKLIFFFFGVVPR
jgi:hypothetical protein